jgi:hypothetical protein
MSGAACLLTTIPSGLISKIAQASSAARQMLPMRNGQTAEPNGAAAGAYAYEGCAVHRRPRSLAGLGEDSAARIYGGSIRCTRDLRDNLDPSARIHSR